MVNILVKDGILSRGDADNFNQKFCLVVFGRQDCAGLQTRDPNRRLVDNSYSMEKMKSDALADDLPFDSPGRVRV